MSTKQAKRTATKPTPLPTPAAAPAPAAAAKPVALRGGPAVQTVN